MNNFSGRSEHPSPGVLLRYVDGELGAKHAARLRDHFEACWACRADLEEVQSSIHEYIRFHQKRLGSASAIPPGEWRAFDARLRDLETELGNRAENAIWRLVEIPFRRGWATGAAAVCGAAAIFILFFGLGQPSRLSAMELLQKSIRSERAGRSLTGRRIRIRYRAQSFVREPGGALHAAASERYPEGDVKRLFVESQFDWDHPLSAQAFDRWHSHLRAKTDEVTPLSDRYRLTTKSHEGLLRQADFEVLMSDFHPVREALDFGEQGVVEISEIGDTAPVFAAAAPARAVLPMTPEPHVRTLPAEPSLDDIESRVWMLLHTVGADLQDAVVIHRTESGIELTGIVNDSNRKEQLEDGIRNLDSRIQVQVSSADEAASEAASTMPNLPASAARPKFDPPAKAWLEAHYPDPGEREQFIEQALSRSRIASVRAYALVQLAERYPPPAFHALSRDARTLILRIVADHAEELRTTWRSLTAQLEPLTGTVSQESNPAGSWQSSVRRCAAATRAFDDSVSRLLAQSSESEPPFPELTQELRNVLGESCQIDAPAQ